MPGVRYIQLAERAAENCGYVTAADAREIGVPIGTVNALARRGQLDRIAQGIYRVPLVPPGPLDQYKLATLWPDGRGRISHESALDLYGISDVNPADVHISVPTSYRTHRAVPPPFRLHHEQIDPADEETVNGIPTVTAEKAIRQVHERHLRPSLVEQAIDDATREGWLRRRVAEQLRRELLAKEAA